MSGIINLCFYHSHAYYCIATLIQIAYKSIPTSIQYKNVTGFGKTCIVHTSNFLTLETHKVYFERQIHVKLSEIVELLFLYHHCKFLICTPYLVVFMDLQMSKTGCVNYAHFPKFSHKF